MYYLLVAANDPSLVELPAKTEILLKEYSSIRLIIHALNLEIGNKDSSPLCPC